MKLSEKAIAAINNRNVRLKLAMLMKVTENAIRNWINDNKEDGDLTRISALHLIHEETGLEQDEILVNTKESHAA